MALNPFRLPSLQARTVSHFALGLLILTFPLSLYWVLIPREIEGVYRELTDLVVYPSDGAMLLLLLSATFHGRLHKANRLKPRSLFLPLLLLALWSAISSFWAFEGWLALQTSLRLFMLFGCAAAVVRLRPDPRFVQRTILATMLVNAGVGILQFLRQDDLGLQALGEQVLNRYPGGGSIIQAGEIYWLRAYGLTPHPNILGGLAVVCIVLLLAPALQSRSSHRPFWLMAMLAALTSLFLSFSRAAWLGGATAATILTVVLAKHRPLRRAYGRKLVVTAIAGALLLIMLMWTQWPLLRARSNPNSSQFERRSVEERAALNEAARELIRQASPAGVGAGNSTPALQHLLEDVPEVGVQPIHNVLLLVTAELGPIGGILWLWLMGITLVVTWHRMRQGRLTMWALLITVALLAFAIIDLFDYYAWVWNQGRAFRWLLWGLWGAAVNEGAGEGADMEPLSSAEINS